MEPGLQPQAARVCTPTVGSTCVYTHSGRHHMCVHPQWTPSRVCTPTVDAITCVYTHSGRHRVPFILSSL